MYRAQRLSGMDVSLIVQISEAANARRAAGEDIISLGTGEPDYATPDHVCQAAITAMQEGDTKYPPNTGKPLLRQAVVDSFLRHHAITNYQIDNVIISTGAKQVLFNAFMATLNPGDEVIIPAPYWTSYSDIVSIAGGISRIIPCGMDSGFKLTPSQLEAAITQKTRWLLLNSPNNPTGAVYNATEWADLQTVLKKHPHVAVMSDEIYEHLTYTGAPISAVNALPEIRDRILIVNGVSKAYAMTGWRLGYGVGPAELIKSMAIVQGQATSGASSISQAGALAALSGEQSLLSERRRVFQARRDRLVSMLNRIPNIACQNPDGAFYVFPSCHDCLGKKTPESKVLNSDLEFCQYILQHAGVALVPGSAFGLSGHFRISYAYAQKALDLACERIANAVSLLK